MEKSAKKSDLMKKNRVFLVIIVIAIVVAVVIGVVVFRGKGENQDVNQNNQQGSNEQNATQKDNVNEHLDGQIDYTKNENVQIKDNVKENNSNALLKEKEFAGMKVKNIKLTASNGITKFLATVENTSNADFKNQKIVIVFKNKDGSEFARLNAYVGDIKVGATSEIDASTTSDLSNAYDFVIEKGK